MLPYFKGKIESHRFCPQSTFGYKDFIPMFKAGKFGPEQWAELLEQSGAKYVVPIAEHHNGFPMYNGSFKEWDATLLTQRAKEDGDGWLIPVDWPNPMRDTPHPLATLREPIQLTNTNLSSLPATYWLFADGKPAEKDERYSYYQRAEERGWPVKSFPWDHNPQRSRPSELTKELAKFLNKSN